MVTHRVAGSLLALTVGIVPVAGGDRSAAQLAALCASCHRLDKKPSGIPPIVSLDADQLVAMMKSFRIRPSSHIMYTVSRSLSDNEVAAVAGYLSALATKGER